MKKNMVDLLKTMLESKYKTNDDATWSKILDCINKGADIFSPYLAFENYGDRKLLLWQDPPIYAAFLLCNSRILERLFNYADSQRKVIDLSYHKFDCGQREEDENKRYQWNVYQHSLIYYDISNIKVITDYAIKHNQDPKALTRAKIIIQDDIEISVNELIVSSISNQAISTINNQVYDLDRCSDIKDKANKWLTNSDVSVTNEFTTDNPLHLMWSGRTDVLRFLIERKYLDLNGATTSKARPFHEWINIVSKTPKAMKNLVNAHSQASLKKINTYETKKEDIELINGPATADGVIFNFASASELPVRVGINFYTANELVQKAVLKEQEEADYQRQLGLARAQTPIRRESFDKVKNTVNSLSAVRIKEFNDTRTDEERVCFNTLYQTVLLHISARQLTATELLDANPVTRSAKIGNVLQTVFSASAEAASLPGGGALPAITRLILDISTKRQANKQSKAMLDASLMVQDVESMLLDLSEEITKEIMLIYRSNADEINFKKVAENIAKETIKSIDANLYKTEINSNEELRTFLYKQFMAACHNRKPVVQFSPNPVNNSDTSSGSSSGKAQEVEANNTIKKNKKKGSGGCTIS